MYCIRLWVMGGDKGPRENMTKKPLYASTAVVSKLKRFYPVVAQPDKSKGS